MKKIFENAVWWSGVVMVGLVLGLTIQFVKAWTEPTVAPPGGNIGAPINTGINTQNKSGMLGVGGLMTSLLNLGNPANQPQAGNILSVQSVIPPVTPGGTATAQVAWASGSGTYALIQDQKPQGICGGAFSSGWLTRDLNTEVVDLGNIATPGTNEFTLNAGTYRIRVEVPAWNVNQHKARLYNKTDSRDVGGCLGSSAMSASGYSGHDTSNIMCEFTISGTKTFEIKHHMGYGCGGSGCKNGSLMACMGLAADIAGYPEIYTQVEIWKL